MDNFWQFFISMKIVEVKNLTKCFAGNRAVDGLNFFIEKGEILGLLGPNGAGKSTTIEMLLGLIKPTYGQIKIFGKDIKKHREEILTRANYSSSYLQFMSRLTVQENLKFFGYLYNVKNLKQKINELAQMLEITNLLSTLFFKLSSGQKTRVVLAKTLLNDPELLFLDEPTAGLDPDIAHKIRGIFKKIHKEHKITILWTSHNMAEVEEMCQRIIFLQKGKIVASGAPKQLKQKLRGYYLELSFSPEKERQLIDFLKTRNLSFEVRSLGHLFIKTKASDLSNVLKQLSQHNFGIYDIDINKPDLEEVFLKLVL